MEMAFLLSSVHIKLIIMITLTLPHGNDKSVIRTNILIYYDISEIALYQGLCRVISCNTVKFTGRIGKKMAMNYR